MMMLTMPSQAIMAGTSGHTPAASSPMAPPMKAAPTRMLASGPATAISPSALGDGASRLRRAMPPSSHSSMPSVCTP